MHIKTFFKNLKKRASGSVETAIKVLTAVVLGAAILMGLYGLITGVVLPSTETAVNSMFAYSAEANGGNGGTEIPTPAPETPEIGEVCTFNIKMINEDSSEEIVSVEYEYGMTWGDWLETDYRFVETSNGTIEFIKDGDSECVYLSESMQYLASAQDSVWQHYSQTIDGTVEYCLVNHPQLGL